MPLSSQVMVCVLRASVWPFSGFCAVYHSSYGYCALHRHVLQEHPNISRKTVYEVLDSLRRILPFEQRVTGERGQ